nr:vacuolar protein sorting-associated protein 4A-like [Quercus suber]
MEIFFDTFQVESNDAKNVLVFAATNTPYVVDMAMRRRFDKRIYIPLPNLKAREQIFKALQFHPATNQHKSRVDNVLATQKPTESEADLKVYEKYTKECGLYR